MAYRRLASLALLALLVSGCSLTDRVAGDTDTGTGGELQANRWVLRSYASAGGLAIVPDDEYADAEFRTDRVSGFGGCGDYTAVYRAEGRLLRVTMAAYTSISCGETTDTFQTTYLSLLGASHFYSVGRDSLTIRDQDRNVVLEFVAAPPNPLLGSWVVESYATTPGTPIAPIAGTELSVVFRLSRIGGSSGCNTFQGTYTQNGNLARIGPLATTQMACAENINAQETAFLTALQGIGRIDPRGQRLDLTDLGGSVVVALIRPSAIPPPPSPSPSAPPSAVPSAPPSPSPTPVPPSPSASAAPTPSPTATPTTAPTATPTAAVTAIPSSSPAPTVVPPASLPPTATCTLGASTIVYPATWFTLPAPSTAACKYFSAAPITTPPDPATLITGVMIVADPAASYADALTAATNPTAWNVLTNQPVTVSGLPATRIEATSTAGVPGLPVGTTRYGYLINVTGKGVWLETAGTVGDAAYTTAKSVVDLMASQSTLVVPIPF